MDGQIDIFDYLREPFSIKKPIRLIETFAGYGSQNMALRNIGANFEPYRVVEFDKYAIASYNAIHGTNFPTIDIKDVHAEDLAIVDKDKYTYILFYSFPCTDISVAGAMKGMAEDSGTRSSLLWEVKRILEELYKKNELPDVLIMENVVQIHNDENLPHFQRFLKFLEDIGYSNYVNDLNAYDFGIPQNRDRTFAVSLLGNYTYKFPHSDMELNSPQEDYFEDLTEEEALKYVVKDSKALDLLVMLDEKNELV